MLDLTPPYARAPALVTVSEWGGQDTVKVPVDMDARKGSVFVESENLSVLRRMSNLSDEEYRGLLQALKEQESLTLVHEEDFVTEYNETSDHCWGRIRRYEATAIPPDAEQSIVLEDSTARQLSRPTNTSNDAQFPMISCFALQQSTQAASKKLWVRVVGVVKYDDKTFGIVQEWDGQGFIVALGSAELKPLFMLEVVMAFSDALYRGSHDMWIGARYKAFRYRYATWSVEQVDGIGPAAEPFYANMGEALARLGYPELAPPLVQQLKRVSAGFEAASSEKLVADAKAAVSDA